MTKIRELSDYELVVGDSVERDGTKAYQIIHKEFGVIETETFILPQAFDYLEQLQAALDAGQDMAEEALEDMESVSISTTTKYEH